MFSSFFQVVLFFFVYSFLGFLAEVAAEVWHKKRVVNRGFLLGPCCPIYGVAAILITFFLSKYQKEPVTLFIMSMVICGILEYVTSYLMEKLFKARWWDYSEKKFNLNGRVSLDALALFATGSLIIMYFINPLVFKLFNVIPKTLMVVLSVLLLLTFVADVIISFKAVIEIRGTINKFERDNTFEITEKVKEVLNKRSYLNKRLVKAFPRLRAIKNKK